MTDADLAHYLNCTQAVVARLAPSRRATYERMAQIEIEAGAWLAGHGQDWNDCLVSNFCRSGH